MHPNQAELLFPLPQLADQAIKNLEDQQDEYDFKINTLKSRGELKKKKKNTGKHTRLTYGRGQ